ncbi:MAG TPA: hypothetical protein VMR70_19205 [Flavisolibacter sp.]|nr:hypothetical protein [Flavisolibacter sp.]
MTSTLTIQHKQLFEQIKKSLTTIGARETNFLKIELLFYDAISIARTYGDDPKSNQLLAALKFLQMNGYQETKTLFKKSLQRERVIRKFISQLRSILSAGCKNQYVLFISP